MNILVLQETDWLTRGPHIQHHIIERLSENIAFKITIIDYDIDKIYQSTSLLIKKQLYQGIGRTIKKSNITIIRTAHIQVPFLRRISSLITNFFQILKLFRKNRPDIIIGYSITNGLIGLLLAKFFKIPFIFHYIDILHELIPFTYAQNIARIITRFMLKHADKVLTMSKFHQNYVINEGVFPKNVEILPTGVSLENTIVNKEKLEQLKSKLSVSNNDFVIFFMGYMYEFAGLKEIIDYYDSDVKDGKLNLKFIILGDFGIYNSLVNYVKNIGADWVIIQRRVPYFDITEYIALADLCLLSFKINNITREITPQKIFEYMAMKKPVLSTNLPGVMLEIGKNNGVIFVKNQKELIRKIGGFISQRKKLEEIGQTGFNLVKKNYSWPEIINQFNRIMIDILRKKNL